MADVPDSNKALSDLKKLIFKGYITEVVEIDGVKFKLKTLNLQEEASVLEESGLTDNPTNAKELLKYIPVVLSYSIISVNDVSIPREQILNMLKQSNAPNILAKLYDAFSKLALRRADAAEELKNS